MKILVFTIAMRGYAQKWKTCIESQKQYCQKHSYTYRVITEKQYPNRLNKGVHPRWKKLDYLTYVLRNEPSFDHVLLLDADILVNVPKCPPVQSVLKPNKCIYAVRGNGKFTKDQVNSGFIFVKRCAAAVRFFAQLLGKRRDRVPAKYKITSYGEGGHFWYMWSMHQNLFEILPIAWNNFQETEMSPGDEYMRHFTGVVGKEFHAPPAVVVS